MLRLSEAQYRRLVRGAPIGRATKYLNISQEINGRRFDSKWEAQHYGELRVRERAGEIRALRCQVDLPIVVRGQYICGFRADFVYEELEDGCWRERVVDTKSEPTRTPAYRIKKKLLAALGIEIIEVLKPGGRSWRSTNTRSR